MVNAMQLENTIKFGAKPTVVLKEDLIGHQYLMNIINNKNKIKSYKVRVSENFHRIPIKGSLCICLSSVILIDSIFKM